jgi:hypothetical protein
MFKNPPKILAHKSAIIDKNYVTPEYILNNSGNTVNLFNRYCPHRMYPLAQPGEQIENTVCKFHGFSWEKNGTPINNDRKIACGKSTVGKSGLIFKDFVEPAHQWVNDLASETELVYSHSCHGVSKGSWLWMMEIQADLLHIRQGDNVIHPDLSDVTNLDDVKMEDGDGWILQTCSTGWWLFIYPFTFIEWSPGCVSVNYTTPNNINDEFGFTWNTQFYYAPHITENKRKEFETLEDVFLEDVEAIEKQKGKYFPIIKPYNRLEDHCVHFGKWYRKNLLK